MKIKRQIHLIMILKNMNMRVLKHHHAGDLVVEDTLTKFLKAAHDFEKGKKCPVSLPIGITRDVNKFVRGMKPEKIGEELMSFLDSQWLKDVVGGFDPANSEKSVKCVFHHTMSQVVLKQIPPMNVTTLEIHKENCKVLRSGTLNDRQERLCELVDIYFTEDSDRYKRLHPYVIVAILTLFGSLIYVAVPAISTAISDKASAKIEKQKMAEDRRRWEIKHGTKAPKFRGHELREQKREWAEMSVTDFEWYQFKWPRYTMPYNFTGDSWQVVRELEFYSCLWEQLAKIHLQALSGTRSAGMNFKQTPKD